VERWPFAAISMAWHRVMLHLRAHTFAPLAVMDDNQLNLFSD
jgi:hypothetical protein